MHASSQKYKEEADRLELSKSRYWGLLLHIVDGKSEIDDPAFFLASDGKINRESELNATIDALLNETTYDDNSTACRFPARKAWLKEKLHISNFPTVECKEYDYILKRLDPRSATLVFPSAHINSPASMFGHTFLRINSGYNSKLLSYAINYAADADPNKENGVAFAFKGLFGGYTGKYSLLPYYDKLKEYRDSEQRDIWEYDLDLTRQEVLRMVQHMWELNGTRSNYYFFTENCSYNMLWFIELARPSIHLREHFNFQVIPLETVHASRLENILKDKFYRPSKRKTLLEYEKVIEDKYLKLPGLIVDSTVDVKSIINDSTIDVQQKRYILEASTELLEYTLSKNRIERELYLEKFHNISKARASLGIGEKLNIVTPSNPIESHRALRTSFGVGYREDKTIGFLGIRPAYHDLHDSSFGFMRGTQIEFLNLELSYSDNDVDVEDATIISIVSMAQRSEFFDSLSWRTKFGWDRDYIDNDENFIATVGAGYSWGNESGYVYIMTDPLVYLDGGTKSAISGSLGLVIDKYSDMSTNIETTKRWYDTGKEQWLVELSQSFRLSQDKQIKLDYNYKDIYHNNNSDKEQTYKFTFNYYF